MRLNKFLAEHTNLSRRAADVAIVEGRVLVNEQVAHVGMKVDPDDAVSLDEKPVLASVKAYTTIMLNKPVGYVCSRDGQGSKTVYDLLPKSLHHLNPVGRLDKDSSGLLLLTNDGQLAHTLTHPSFEKIKQYEIVLNKPLSASHKKQIEQGITLDDGVSTLKLYGKDRDWKVAMYEGRNRQIRRTFMAAGYKVTKLHRFAFGSYCLDNSQSGTYHAV